MIFPWSCCTWSWSTIQPKYSENPISWIFLIRHFGSVNLWFPVLSFKQNKTVSHTLGLKTRERDTSRFSYWVCFSSLCCCSVVKSCLAFGDPMDCSTTPWASLPFTISLSLLKLMFIESVVPSDHLVLWCLLLLLPSMFPSIRVISKDSALGIRWPKYWSFSSSPASVLPANI